MFNNEKMQNYQTDVKFVHFTPILGELTLNILFYIKD